LLKKARTIMDYVPAHGNTNNLADRDNISGARVFDGEDHGNYSLTATLASNDL